MARHHHITDWYTFPKDDGWERCTIASTAALWQRLWLRCNSCCHDVFVDGLLWCEERGIGPETPMLLMAPG